MCYIATQGEADVLVYWWLSNLISYFLTIKEHLPRTPPLRNVKTTVHRNVGDEIVVNHFGPSESVCAENAIHLYGMYQMHKNGTQPITLGTHFVTAISVNEA